jgi:GT2 family glycosyltransferase
MSTSPAVTLPTSDVPRVSIVIVTARDPERLIRCLEAVAREVPSDLPYEVLLVLNAAEHSMRERVARDVSGARTVESEIPLGLAGGANLGAVHARGEFIHVLHDDTEVGPDWLTPLVQLLDRRPEVGAVGCAVLELDGPVQTAGHILWRDGLTTPRWIGEPPRPDQLGAAYPADYCASASLLVRRAAWDATGGCDEGFHPAYYVDVDLAMALRSHGYVVVCEPRSRVRHEKSGTSGAAFRTFLSERHRERFVEKWSHDLQHQEPRADGPDALERAQRATERRAASVAAGPRSAPASSVTDEEDELARLQREHALLRRDVEVKNAYMVFVQQLLTDAEGQAAEGQKALARRHETEAELHRAYAALARKHMAQAERLAAVEAEAEDLRRRAATLAAIEAGGWWRLRSRIRPILRLATPVRAALRRG